MSVEIETTASSMSKSLNSLRTTPLAMHRIVFKIATTQAWYQIMTEARMQFGKNWRSQPRIKRKLLTWRPRTAETIQVWFEVPDPAFATWCAVKLGVISVENINK